MSKNPRKFAYRSSKQRLESLSVSDASRKLAIRRSYEPNDDSFHYNDALLHWKEINLSKNFQDYIIEAQVHTSSLAQLIYYKKSVLATLSKFIDMHDSLSLEPLLELLECFVRDLGAEDFLDLYSECLDTLVSVIVDFSHQNDDHSGKNEDFVVNVLGWSFKAIALILNLMNTQIGNKEGIVTTLSCISPCLLCNAHVVRLCGESLSILLRKCNEEAVKSAIDFFSEKYENASSTTEKINIKTLMVVAFTESIKNVANSIHTKPLTTILRPSIVTLSDSEMFSVVCDIVSRLIIHASSAESIYNVSIESISSCSNPQNTLKFLSTLAFTSSGYKVPSWIQLLEASDSIVSLVNTSDSCELLSFFYTILFRNSPMSFLASNHKRVVKTMENLDQGRWFLGFLESLFSICPEKAKIFCSKALSTFIIGKWQGNEEKIGCLITKFGRDLTITIVPKFQSQLVNELLASTDDLDAYWRLQVLKISKLKIESQVLETLFDKHFTNASAAKLEICGLILECFSTNSYSDSNVVSVLNKLSSIFDSKSSDLSQTFLSGFLKLLMSLSDSHPKSILFIKDNKSKFISYFSELLTVSSHSVRDVCLRIISMIFVKSDEVVPDMLNIVTDIESMALSLENGREFTLKFKKLVAEFSTCDSVYRRISLLWVFGILSNRFKPIWDAVFDSFPSFCGFEEDFMWETCSKFLFKNYTESADEKRLFDDNMDVENSDLSISVLDKRLFDTFDRYHKEFSKYANTKSYIANYANNQKPELDSSSFLRYQTLKCLSRVPSLAEKKARLLVPVVLDNEDVSDYPDWTIKDKNLVIEIFSNFKNIKSIYQSEEVHKKALDLLCSRTPAIQKCGLKIILAYKNPLIRKFADNLGNIVDKTSYKDEITTFFSSNSASDLSEVTGIILRILFGKHKVKASTKKDSIIKFLGSVGEFQIVDFLKLGYESVDFEPVLDSFETGKDFNTVFEAIDIDKRLLRRLTGFVNLAGEVISELKARFPKAIESILRPLIYSVGVAGYCSATDVTSPYLKSIRSQGLKDLSSVFKLFGSTDDIDWSKYDNLVYGIIVKPRLETFGNENAQSPSSLMRLILSWSTSPKLTHLFNSDGMKPALALRDLFENSFTKSTVLVELMQFFSNIIGNDDNDLTSFKEIIVQSCCKTFPIILARDDITKEVIQELVTLLLAFINKDLVQENIPKLVSTLITAFDKFGGDRLTVPIKTDILNSISGLIKTADISSFEQIETVYSVCSKSFKLYSDTGLRTALVNVVRAIGGKIPEYHEVGSLLRSLNAFSSKRIDEVDYSARTKGFSAIFDGKYLEMSVTQWKPILNTCLFYMDHEEASIRMNSRFALVKFIDATNENCANESEASPYVHVLKDLLLPNIRVGIRKSDEKVAKEYVSLVADIVAKSQYYTGLSDMKQLLFGDDEEANFFVNLNHIQIHRRSRAVRRLATFASKLSASSISHYLIPMIERYVFCDDNESLRNLSNDTIETISVLSRHIEWNRYQALVKRLVSYLNEKQKYFRDVVRLVVNVIESISSYHGSDGMPVFVYEIVPKLAKHLAARDDETAIYKIPLSEAMVFLILCLDPEEIEPELPSVLTKISQILRTRHEELRDNVRKSLGKIVATLGIKYLPFVIRELKSALQRGPQIHILSYTVHYLLVSMKETLGYGDLDSVIPMVIAIIVDDLFGTSSEEKEAEGYSSKTKEMKYGKSYDTAEILANFVSLSSFGSVLEPIKNIYRKTVSSRTQTRLNELIRRFVVGLSKNKMATTSSGLILCYQVYTDAISFTKTKGKDSNTLEKALSELGAVKAAAKEESAAHFLVQLDAKPLKTQFEYSQYADTIRKFSLELLRAILSKNSSLSTFSNLKGFTALLEQSMKSDNEGLVISALKVLNVIILLPLDEDAIRRVAGCARSALKAFKNSPSTNSDLAQSCLRFLALCVRHQGSDVGLKPSAVVYILTKLHSDLEDPNRQGLAFNFLKAVLSRKIMVPEIYDIMESVQKTMVTNHSAEVRNMARSTFFQFLMEYDQGRGKLEKEFKFLLGNLMYPTESGRISVLELIESIVVKTNLDLLLKISESFFVGLSNVAVFDDAVKCRESATTILTTLMKKLAPSKNLRVIEKYLTMWIGEVENPQLTRTGFQIYKIYVGTVGLDVNVELDSLFVKKLNDITLLGANSEDDDDGWELTYSGLTTFSVVLSKNLSKEYPLVLWNNLIQLLLYPHSWVRLVAARLIGSVVSNLDKFSFADSTFIEQIAFKSIRQLSAPKITETFGNQVVKNLVHILIYWNSNNVQVLEGKSASNPFEWIVFKTSSVIKNDYRSEDFGNSKKSAIKLMAMMVQISSEEALSSDKIGLEMILALFRYTEDTEDEDPTLVELATECLKMLETKLGVSLYTKLYSKTRTIVSQRRVDRKIKRSQMKIVNPEIAAKRKVKKHLRVREKRKEMKDENGYYHTKKKRRV